MGILLKKSNYGFILVLQGHLQGQFQFKVIKKWIFNKRKQQKKVQYVFLM